ncbi:hypothetical protein KOI35_05680 [Actinoplanes bogorensis]|uniref:Uncharacterized protein n=1 Tax=Paractinoplanes bogorensis TaxID=1610840 RepID=A0ABS5YHN6_9ACTN|nr:hypothetical protein [Actinoplanes bogorensis]MBU2662994.1 hypothetical protein [Actinoplanes bogorensis]
MKRWGAALACGLMLALSLSGVAGAAPSAPAPAATPTACAPLREGNFGPLAADQAGSAEVPSGATGCHQVTLTAGPHYIQVRTTIQTGLRITVRNAAGDEICTGGDNSMQCDIPATGVYTVEVPNHYAQAISYRVAAILQDTAHCTTRVSTRWNATTTPVPSTGIEATCVRFTGSDAEKVYVFNPRGASNVRKLDGSLVCALPTQYNAPCRLTGDGTFLAMTATPPGVTSNEIEVRSVTKPVGCPTHAPKAFGSHNRFSDVRCRVLEVPAAGTYFVQSRTLQNSGQLTGVFDPTGKHICTTGPLPVLQQDVCAFPAAGRYLVIADTLSNRVVRKSFTTTITAMDGPGCRPTTVQGVTGGNIRGSFRAIGQVDCAEFTVPYGVETGIVLPPNASGAGVPFTRIFDSNSNLVCSTSECDLPGPATYRMLLTAPSAAPTGDYILALQDRSSLQNCKPWNESVTATFRPGRFTECFEFVPETSTDLKIAVERLTGSGTMHATVKPSAGAPCDGGDQAAFTCEVYVSNTTRLLLTADPAAASYRITREYATPPGPDPGPDPTPGPLPTPTSCAPLTEGNYGLLAADQIGTATVPVGEVGCHKITLSAGWHYIQVRGTAMNGATTYLQNAQGSRTCMKQAGIYWNCLVREPGVYTLEVMNNWGTEPVSYRAAAILQDESRCTTKISTAWDAEPVRLPQGDPLEAHCVTFDGTAGEKILRFSESGTFGVIDANGNGVCGNPWRHNPPCVLTGEGPYTVSTLAPSEGTSDEIQIRSLTPAVGCPTVTVGGTDQPSDVRCRSLTVPAAGTYDVAALGTGGDTRTIAIYDTTGVSPCESAGRVPNGRCTFPAAGTYTLVDDGASAGIHDYGPYTVKLTPVPAA